jgi:hypothetical protein
VQPTNAARLAVSASTRAAAPAASVSADAISAPDTSCVEKSLSNGSLTSSGSDAYPERVVSPSRSAIVLSYSMRDSRCSPVGPTASAPPFGSMPPLDPSLSPILPVHAAHAAAASRIPINRDCNMRPPRCNKRAGGNFSLRLAHSRRNGFPQTRGRC